MWQGTLLLTKMQGGFVILIQFLIFQNVLSKEIVKDTRAVQYDRFEDAILDNFMLVEYKEQRSLTDIWDNIKNTAKNAWNFLKNLIKSTNEKIKTWVLDVKERALAIRKSFEEHLNKIKLKLEGIIQNFLQNEDVKKCFQNESESMNKILMNVIKHVTSCISEKINGLTPLENYEILNESNFMEEIDANINICKQNKENAEQCLENVRQDILEKTEELEDDVLKNRLMSRSFADDILEAIITCSTDGIIEASAAITNEIVNIIKCLAQIQV